MTRKSPLSLEGMPSSQIDQNLDPNFSQFVMRNFQRIKDILTHWLLPTTQTTVGGAGGAAALPATPVGYLQWEVGGTIYVIPYYKAV